MNASVAPAAPSPSILARFPIYYGWVNVVIAALAMVTTMSGNDQGLGLITEPLLHDLRLDKLQLSNINLAATLIGALALFPTGRLIDRWGARVVMTSILVPLGLAVIGTSHVTHTGHLWAALIAVSFLGQSALSVTSMALVGKWFSRRISMAMGLYAILVVIGYVIAIPLLAWAIKTFGWRAPWQVFGSLILFGLAPLSALAVRATPESLGISGDAPATADPSISGATWQQALRTQAFWLFALAMAFYSLAFGGVMLFYESIFKERGLDTNARDMALAIMMGVGLPVSFVGGWYGQRVSLGKLMAVALVAFAASLWLLTTLNSIGGVVLHALGMGIAGGLVPVIFFAIWPHAFGRAHIGKINGIAQGFCIVATAFGPRTLALFHSAHDSYQLAFRIYAVIGAIFAFWAWWVPISDASKDGGGAVEPSI